MFPGEDQWAPVTEDDDKDWVCVGDKHHQIGQSHNEWHYPHWGDKKGSVPHRQVLLWKETDFGQIGETTDLKKSMMITKGGQ